MMETDVRMSGQDIVKTITIFILSMLVVGGYIYDIYLVLNGKVDTAADPQKALMVGQALGNLQGMASIILAFYFGTTQGNKDKDKLTSDVISKLPTSPSIQTTTTTTASPDKTPI